MLAWDAHGTFYSSLATSTDQEQVSGLRETLEGSDEEEITQAEQVASSDLQQDPNSSYSFLFNQSQAAGNDRMILQPLPAVRSTLLQVYRDRVDCLFKVLHLPTVYSELGSPWPNNHNDSITTTTRLLEHAIYFLAICSLSPDECKRLQLGDRTSLIAALRTTTEMLLSKSGLLTTTRLVVLQAFVLYLVSEFPTISSIHTKPMQRVSPPVLRSACSLTTILGRNSLLWRCSIDLDTPHISRSHS